MCEASTLTAVCLWHWTCGWLCCSQSAWKWRDCERSWFTEFCRSFDSASVVEVVLWALLY